MMFMTKGNKTDDKNRYYSNPTSNNNSDSKVNCNTNRSQSQRILLSSTSASSSGLTSSAAAALRRDSDGPPSPPPGVCASLAGPRYNPGPGLGLANAATGTVALAFGSVLPFGPSSQTTTNSSASQPATASSTGNYCCRPRPHAAFFVRGRMIFAR